MKLTLLDRYGDQSEAFILNYGKPVLTDADGVELVDMNSNPFYPQRYQQPKPTDHPYKMTLDAFMVRPHNPYLSNSWVGHPDWPGYQPGFEALQYTVFLLTGKTLIAVEP